MATTWKDFYVAGADNGGPVQDLWNRTIDELGKLSENCTNNVPRLCSTINSSNGANVLMIPSGSLDIVEFIHNGVVTSTHLGGPEIVMFAHRNLSESPFKVLDVTAAVTPIFPPNTRKKTLSAGCPELSSMYEALTDGEFSDLPGEGNGILKGKPLHLWLHPSLLVGVNCARRTSASELAIKLIEEIRTMEDAQPPPSEQELVEIQAQKDGLHTVLAFLWAAANKLLAQVPLGDLPESPQLNYQCETIRSKIRPAGAGHPGAGPDPANPAGTTTGELTALTSVAQTLMTAIGQNEAARRTERDEDKAAKSLIRSLGPTQQRLFQTLATDDLRDAPTKSKLMTEVLACRSPTAAVNRIRSEMTAWQGTVSMSGLHRFFANGFMSEESNRADPGGLSIFSCYPRTRDSGPVAFNKDKAQLREHLKLDVDDETLSYYLKRDLFVAKDIHELTIQFETFRKLLELLSVHDTVATHGLTIAIRGFREYYTQIQEMIVVSPNFCLKILYAFDKHIQRFYQMVAGLGNPATSHTTVRNFLSSKAERIMEDLADGIAPSVILPASLANPHPENTPEDVITPVTRTPKERGKSQDSTSPDVNKEVQAGWKLPQGVTYASLFSGPSPNLGGWPILQDTPRLKGPKPMCIRFQSTGTCRKNCFLAHTVKSKMNPKDAQTATARFKEIYALLS
jgi:hypothetical protein